jgi:hypothetical protein
MPRDVQRRLPLDRVVYTSKCSVWMILKSKRPYCTLFAPEVLGRQGAPGARRAAGLPTAIRRIIGDFLSAAGTNLGASFHSRSSL